MKRRGCSIGAKAGWPLRRSRTKPQNAIVPSQRLLVQAGVYRNDRQVREKHVFHAIDPKNPRAEVVVEPLQAQQPDLLGADLIAEAEVPF